MDEPLTDSNYLILLALLEPKHGYAIMKEISEITQERVTIGPASMYTILKKLVKSEYITLEQDDDRKKIYLITELGISKLESEVERRKLFYQAGERLLLENKR
ncbi:MULTISPECIES: helix-turn-helix transcriptional regulator [Vagococcus]|uniref:Transcriptional regulator, PadR family n=1 Tax=Vagococcus fluvialis bH819 TaxID=1255619 RepID=A0A1X6WNF5_9ENTE|nr:MULTISPECIES: helix-turn-helix transcriptional regulator [Vagococcus]SLM85216.1 Transcriptional regulator, PadR family [Vagococcus fluvialis bH819]HCM88371.1 PadR family transcriptional regulator [Vagococcus sp.]